MFKRALISVSDKSGLVEFLKPLVQEGLNLVSTGGTAKHLREAGFKVSDVSDQTQFPEIMGGRVKTLHPKIHMALLYREESTGDMQLLKQHGVEPFDLVICNLYPFEESLRKGKTGEELIEQIDIGGPSMLRGAAKNFARVAVVCDPADYSWVAASKGQLSYEQRQKLAAKVFAHTGTYDTLVAQALSADQNISQEHAIAGRVFSELRYGENPQQTALWYRRLGDDRGLHSSEILQGKALSYNNLLDLEAASALVQAFTKNACVVVKHNNPCGVAIADSVSQACARALAADPVSAFGGIVAFNASVDVETAQQLSGLFLECVVAPEFSPEAVSIFKAKKNLRILKWVNLKNYTRQQNLQLVAGGFLVQSVDATFGRTNDWKYFGDSPTDQILSDLLFGERVCAGLKSNSIAIVRQGQTLGLGMGQVNRVDAVKQAIERATTHHSSLEGACLISDAFFPFPDSIELIAKAGLKWILQPGGSVKDQEVIECGKKHKVNQVFTGTRHFKH